MKCALCGGEWKFWKGLITHPDNGCSLACLDLTQGQINRVNAAIEAAKKPELKECMECHEQAPVISCPSGDFCAECVEKFSYAWMARKHEKKKDGAKCKYFRKNVYRPEENKEITCQEDFVWGTLKSCPCAAWEEEKK